MTWERLRGPRAIVLAALVDRRCRRDRAAGASRARRAARRASTGSPPCRSPGTSRRTCATRSRARTSTRAKTTFQTVVYRQFTKDWAKPIPNEEGDRGIQGPLLHANVGDIVLVHFENLDTLNNRPHSMHFHGFHYRPGSDGAYLPGFSGPGRERAAGQVVHLPARRAARTRSASGRTTTTRRRWTTRSRAASTARSRSSARASSSPTRSSSSTSRRRSTSRRSTAARSSATRPSSTRRSATSSSGTCSRSATTTTPSTCTATAGRHPAGADIDTLTVGPAESFRIRWREEDPGTWFYHCHVEGHMMQGMIGIYRVSR